MLDSGAATSRSMTLPDGRRLSFAEFGDPAGRPVMFFHGSPGSRIDGEWLAMGSTGGKDARIVSPDRPGYGYSTPVRRRSMDIWADDVARLADHLGIGHFAVSGSSGGGPYALACAALLPDRVVATGLLASAAPPELKGTAGEEDQHLGNRIGNAISRVAPFLERPLFGALGLFARIAPQQYIRLGAKVLPEGDRRVVDDPRMRENIARSVREQFRRGAAGVIVDDRCLKEPWPFELGSIRVPVYLWHGDEDKNVPPSQGRQLAGAVAGAKLSVLDGEGHLLLPAHADAVLAALTDPAVWPDDPENVAPGSTP